MTVAACAIDCQFSDASDQQIASARCCSNYGCLDASAVVIRCVYLQTRACSCDRIGTTAGQMCMEADARVLPQLRTLRRVRLQTRACCGDYGWSGAYDCRCARAAEATADQVCTAAYACVQL